MCEILVLGESKEIIVRRVQREQAWSRYKVVSGSGGARWD